MLEKFSKVSKLTLVNTLNVIKILTDFFLFFSVRYNWHREKGSGATKNVPRLIVFILGGVTFSEMRVAYEVTKAGKNWEVVMGKYFLNIVLSLKLPYFSE